MLPYPGSPDALLVHFRAQPKGLPPVAQAGVPWRGQGAHCNWFVITLCIKLGYPNEQPSIIVKQGDGITNEVR